MAEGETFTELDVAEREDLAAAVRDVELHHPVRLTWVSARSGSPVSIGGRSVPLDRLRGRMKHVELAVATDERKGTIYVEIRDKHMENAYHAPIVAHSTGSRYTSRTPRLGELLEVEVLDG